MAKGLKDRKMQRALMQFFKPENWFTVREALIEAKRTDLIGVGCDCLIPANPPKEALEKRRRDAQRAVEGDHYHKVANPAISDHKNRVYYFEATASPSLLWVKLDKVDFKDGSGVRKLTLVGKPDLGGDQTANFEKAEPFKFLAPPRK